MTREANMDGELHVEGECCGEGSILGRTCTKCGGRLHRQPVYGGVAELCERCPEDAAQWHARGTYRTDDMAGTEGKAGSFVIATPITPTKSPSG